MKKILFPIFLALVITGCANNSNNVFQGYVEGNYTYLSSPLGGKLQQLKVARGDKVKPGELIFVLDHQPEATKLKQACDNLVQSEQILIDLTKGQRKDVLEGLKAQRAQIIAQLNLDKKTLTRYRKLFKTGAIDRSSVDMALAAYQRDLKKISEINANLAEAKLGARENQIKAQQAAVASARANVKHAKWALKQKTGYASVAGQIFDTYYRVGEYVNAGQPIVSMLTPGNVKLIFFVPETIIGSIKIGQKLSFDYDGCAKKLYATISYISSDAEYTPPVIYSRESREKLIYRVEAKVTADTAIKLRVGQPIDVRI